MATAALFVQDACGPSVAAGSVMCPSHLLHTLKPASFQTISASVTDKDASEFTHDKHLGTIKELLLPGGQYTHSEASSRPADDVSLELMISGLDVTSTSSTDGATVLVATLPAVDTGAAPLPGKGAGASAWGVVDASAELVDEDALLADDNADDAIKASGDCSTKPRACANCSCGRAEAEAKADSAAFTEEQLQSFTSACGNCFKGDAFRCASCPHRGKPAFVPGMEGVMLDLGADDADGPIAIE